MWLAYKDKMSQYQDDSIKTLSGQLGSLKITNEALERITEYTNKISEALVPIQENNRQARVPKNMVSNPRQFDGNRTKFEDQQREIRLFLKSNKVMETDNRITVILVCLKESVVGIYVQKKLDGLNKEIKTQNWDKFV